MTQSEKWIDVQLPFREFVPVFRGRVVSDAPILQPDRVRRIGFMIADKQEGPFCLEIDWVKAYSDQ
jgi:monofunctional biosynthetic peptidoglycan transglycosylase